MDVSSGVQWDETELDAATRSQVRSRSIVVRVRDEFGLLKRWAQRVEEWAEIRPPQACPEG